VNLELMMPPSFGRPDSIINFLGRKISVTDGENPTVWFDYDQRGNLVKQINRDKGITSWEDEIGGNIFAIRRRIGYQN
jgi:YD repeat-containing protein